MVHFGFESKRSCLEWFSFDFTGFYWVLPGFYRVLPSYYWVLLNFHRIYRVFINYIIKSVHKKIVFNLTCMEKDFTGFYRVSSNVSGMQTI